MYAGQVIQYKVSPFPGITTKWVTEITHVENGSYFVDEQRFGPYQLWHHKHFIREIEGGVAMDADAQVLNDVCTCNRERLVEHLKSAANAAILYRYAGYSDEPMADLMARFGLPTDRARFATVPRVADVAIVDFIDPPG